MGERSDGSLTSCSADGYVEDHGLRLCGLRGPREMKEKKNGELHIDPSVTSRLFIMAQPQHLLFHVAEHFTQGIPETTCSDGKHDSRLDNVLPKTAALRAVRRFEVSQEQVVPKHKLLVVEIDLEMYTATLMVMVSQVKLEAPEQNKLEKDFDKNWDGKRQHFVERCDRRAFDKTWEVLSDGYNDAFLKQQNENIDEKKTAGNVGNKVCARTCVPKADARFHGRSRCADQEEDETDSSI